MTLRSKESDALPTELSVLPFYTVCLELVFVKHDVLNKITYACHKIAKNIKATYMQHLHLLSDLLTVQESNLIFQWYKKRIQDSFFIIKESTNLHEYSNCTNERMFSSK